MKMANRWCLIFLCSLSLDFNEARNQGVYFVPRGEKYVSHNSWLVTFTFNLEPYRQHINELKTEIDRFYNMFLHVSNNDNVEGQSNNTKVLVDELFYLLENERVQFEREYEDISELWQGIQILSSGRRSRNKRAILPFVSSILKQLFGTATTKDLNQLKRTLAEVAGRQSKISHVLEESLTVINKTHHVVKENRQVINRLSAATDSLSMGLAAIYDNIIHSVEPRLQHVQLATKLHNVFHIVSSTMRQTHIEMLSLSNQIEKSIRGTITPQLVKPQLLLNIIRDVQGSLPQDASLPYSIESKNLIQYYRQLFAVFLPDKNSFHVLTALPIVTETQAYNLYEPIVMPTQSENMSFTATYNLEEKYLAMAKDHSVYALVSEMEAMECMKTDFCNIRSPYYRTTGSPSCLSSLYLKNEDLIRSVCKKSIKWSTGDPVVKHIVNGNWAISTKMAFDIEIKCIEDGNPARYKSDLTQLSTGTTLITLNPGCLARSKYFNLPIFTSGEHDVRVETEFWDAIRLPGRLPDIWEGAGDITNFLPVIPDHIPNLGQIAELPLDHMQHIMHELARRDHDMQIGAQKGGILRTMFWVTGVVFMIIIFCVVGLIIVYKKVYKTRIYEFAHTHDEIELGNISKDE
jgi:hypothetical protein